MKITYRFVPYGTTAPDPVNKKEIWVDTGGRSSVQVFDHHGGDTDAESASELVLAEYQRYIPEFMKREKHLTLVLHIAPDIDAICSAWLVAMILKQGNIELKLPFLESIVKKVSENDQGLVRTSHPKTCWIVVFRTFLATGVTGYDDEAKVMAGIGFLEKTVDMLAKGGSLNLAAHKLVTRKTAAALDIAVDNYLLDIKRAQIFQTFLPIKQEPLFPGTATNDHSAAADSLLTVNPKSVLFKELARSDVKNSPGKNGFQLLIVVRTFDFASDRVLKRYIISTDPLSGFHLKGLGRELEKMEQKKEDAMGLPLLSGRERIKPGKGRFGWNVSSPWYDGRGHHFTIVDSPSVTVGKKIVCGSCLDTEEVLGVLKKKWMYR